MGGALTFSDNKGSAPPPAAKNIEVAEGLERRKSTTKKKQQKKNTVTIKEWI